MLTIRNVQLQVFGEQPRRRFEQALTAHLRRYFPHECERGDVNRFVRLGVDCAEYHGIETERDVALYLNLMAMLGCDFDRDPQIPWAGTDLDTLSIRDVHDRILKVYETALAYLDEIGGTENALLVRAGLRILRQEMDVTAPPEPDELPALIAEWLAVLYPEKARRQGPEAMAALAALAVESARAQGATRTRSACIHAMLMLMLGSGYFRDPLYSWLNGLLNDSNAGDVDARFDAMLESFRAYLNVTLRKSNAQ